MDPKKYIEQYLADSADLEKMDISRARLATDYVKIGFENRKFWLSLVSIAATLGGLVFGSYQFIQNQRSQFQTQKNHFESQIALRFFSLKREDKYAYIENLVNFGEFSPEFIQKLKNGLVYLPNSVTNKIEDQGNSSDKTKVYIDAMSGLIKSLISKKSKTRRKARQKMASELESCKNYRCLSFVESALNTENLITSEKYRLALGITVALSNVSVEGYNKLLANFKRSKELNEKLQKLASLSEPTIKSHAIIAIKKISDANS